MLGSEWLKDGKFLGRDKLSKFCTGYDSSSANNNAHPSMPLHSVCKQTCQAAFSARAHLRSAWSTVVPGALPLRPSQAAKLTATEQGRLGMHLLSQTAAPCQHTYRVCSWQQEPQHLSEPLHNAVTPCFPRGIPCKNSIFIFMCLLQIMWPKPHKILLALSEECFQWD